MSQRKRSAKRTNSGKTQFLALGFAGAGLIILGVLALMLLPKGGAATNPTSQGAIPVAVNFPAPALTLTGLSGETISLADFHEHVVLVNNWATWCPPCKEEMPTLQAYYAAHQGQGFTTVAIEAGEPVEQVAEFARSMQLTFQVLPDPDMRALDAFKNMNLPSSYVIDRNGMVRLAWTGAVSRNTLEKYVTPLLEE